MFHKNILIFLSLIIHLTSGLKSTDFCILKQKECRGYYDKQQQENYKIKCTPIKCHGKLAYECESNSICSVNKIECDEYRQMDSYRKIINTVQTFNTKFANKHSMITNKIQSFNKEIKYCQNKYYKFKSNDFCLNGKNCAEVRKELIGFGFSYRKITITRKIDCKCPASKSFKCDKYCTTDSIACDYYKSLKIQNQFSNINECGNNNVTSYGSMNYF